MNYLTLNKSNLIRLKIRVIFINWTKHQIIYCSCNKTHEVNHFLNISSLSFCLYYLSRYEFFHRLFSFLILFIRRLIFLSSFFFIPSFFFSSFKFVNYYHLVVKCKRSCIKRIKKIIYQILKKKSFRFKSPNLNDCVVKLNDRIEKINCSHTIVYQTIVKSKRYIYAHIIDDVINGAFFVFYTVGLWSFSVFRIVIYSINTLRLCYIFENILKNK